MAFRWRDFPDLKKPEPEPEVKPSPAAEPDERIDVMMAQLQRLEARISEASEGATQLDEVMAELKKMKSEAKPVASIAPPSSEWVFDVERGPYNEIKQVNARRRSTLERAH